MFLEQLRKAVIKENEPKSDQESENGDEEDEDDEEEGYTSWIHFFQNVYK